MKNFITLNNDDVKISPFNEKAFGTRKPPKCAMCRNHGIDISTRDHKACEHKKPDHLKKCKECRLTDQRRISISKEIKILRRNEATVRNIENHPQVSTLSSGGQRRQQLCRKCGFHGKIKPMRNHKNYCPYKACACNKGCKEVGSRCAAFNNEAKFKRKLIPNPSEQPKKLPNDSVIEINVTSVDDKPLPQFNSTFCTKSQTYTENRVQFNNYSYTDAAEQNNYAYDLIEPVNLLNINQYEQIIDDKAYFIDQSETYFSVSEPIANIPYYSDPQNYKNRHEDLNTMEYDDEIVSVIDNFTIEHYESYLNNMNYHDMVFNNNY